MSRGWSQSRRAPPEGPSDCRASFWICTEKFEFFGLVDFGEVAFSEETGITTDHTPMGLGPPISTMKARGRKREKEHFLFSTSSLLYLSQWGRKRRQEQRKKERGRTRSLLNKFSVVSIEIYVFLYMLYVYICIYMCIYVYLFEWVYMCGYIYIYMCVYICRVYLQQIKPWWVLGCQSAPGNIERERKKKFSSPCVDWSECALYPTGTCGIKRVAVLLQCIFHCVAVYFSVLQCVAVWTGINAPSTSQGCMVSKELQCVAVCCSVLRCVAVWSGVLQCDAVCCSVMQCVAVCCSVLQCVAVCCSVQCGLWWMRPLPYRYVWDQ